MRTILAIAKKELMAYLTTMWGWAFITFMGFISAFSFLAAIAEFKEVQRAAVTMGGWDRVPAQFQTFRNLTDGVIVPLWSILLFLTLIFAAMLAARLFAEERKQKTFELLMTAPVRSLEIVLGKYLGGLGVVVLMLAVTLVYPGVLVAFGATSSGNTLDWGVVWLGYAAVLMVGATSLAVGMFVSSLTESVIVSALVSAILVLLWMLARAVVPQDEPWRGFVSYFMLDTHLQNLLRGILDLKPLVFFASAITLFLMLTHRAVESQRWS